MELQPDLLNHPNIPKPLYGLNPRSIKGQEWWDAIRQEVYKSTNYHCKSCGVHKSEALFHNWLEAHESYTIDYAKGRVKIIEIVPLCHACHSFIHSEVLHEEYIKKGDWQKGRTIIQHGCNVLTKAGLGISKQNWLLATTLYCVNIPPVNEEIGNYKDVAWEKWYLEFDGMHYYSRFKNLEG